MKTTIQIRKRNKMSPSDAKVLVEYCNKHPEIATGVLITRNIQEETRIILDGAEIDYIAGIGTDEEVIQTAEISLNARLSDRVHFEEEIEKCSTDYKPEESKKPKIMLPQDKDSKPKTQKEEIVSGYVAECTDEFADVDDFTTENQRGENISSVEPCVEYTSATIYHADVRIIPRRIRKDLATQLVEEVQKDKGLLLGVTTYAGISEKAKRIFKKENRIIALDSNPSMSMHDIRSFLYSKLQELKDSLTQESQENKKDEKDVLYDILWDSPNSTIEALKGKTICKDLGFDMFSKSLKILVHQVISIHSYFLRDIYRKCPEVVAKYFNADLPLYENETDISLFVSHKMYEITKKPNVPTMTAQPIEVSIPIECSIAFRNKGQYTMKRVIKALL